MWRADGGFAVRGESPAGHSVKGHQSGTHADTSRRFRLGFVVVAITLGVMMIAFGMTVTVIVRVLMVGLAAACQKQDSNKEGKKRLHSAETVAALE